MKEVGKRTKKVGPTRGLGSRYGAMVRKRYIKIVEEMKKPHTCPECGLQKVKRESVGLWTCRKCGYTFTGGAYTPTTKTGIVAKRTAKARAEKKLVEDQEEA